jgi:N-acetylglucosaminyl-diphospho-decaprenol L-rhamnosyltransferase
MNLLDQVTLIVVTHHSAHCLGGLDVLVKECTNVIISDNASNDQTPSLVRERWPHVQVLEHSKNLGFGAANNRALEKVDTPFALLLNPDCEMTPSAVIALMKSANQMPSAAVLAPQILKANGQSDINYRWPKTHWKPKVGAAEGLLCVGFVCGAAMLFRMKEFESVGFFDEDFFLYYEDDDLCLRLFNAQRQMVLDPGVKAIHRSRGSVKGRSPWRNEYTRGFHHAQSKLIFARKYQSLEAAQRKQQSLIIQTTLALPFRLIMFSPKLLTRMLGRWMGALKWNSHD